MSTKVMLMMSKDTSIVDRTLIDCSTANTDGANT